MPPTPTYEQLLAENIALREENLRLRQRLGMEDSNAPADHCSQDALAFTIPEHQPPESPPSLQPQFPDAAVHHRSSVDDKIDLFMTLFRGREDIYARRYHNQKTGKEGYVPACRNEWVYGVCDKKKNKCGTCPNRSFIPFSRDVVYRHLSGKKADSTDVAGLYPLTKDECCYFLAIDFDDGAWQSDITAFRSTCKEYGLTPAVERSRGGNGGHVWFFFEDKISAATARKFGSALLTQAMARRHEIEFKSYDRLLPNQDIMPKGGFGNLIALPLQGARRKEDNSVFVDDNFVSYDDQWAFLSCIERLSLDQVEGYVKRLCGNSELGVLAIEEPKPWERTKPAPELSLLDFTGKVQIVKANMLHIGKTGLSQGALNRIKRLGAFRNPDFYKAQAMRLPTKGKPRVIDCTQETTEYLSIPRGCEDELLALLESAGASCQVEDKRNPGMPIAAEFNGTLRMEQEIAASALLQHETGVLAATTAFGKTVIGSYLISKRKVNTLILVHTGALFEQWKKSLQQFLDTECEIGQLGAQKNTLHGKIDIAIMQSLVSGEDVKPLVLDYGMVIADECHHISASSYESIPRTANAKYVYGLTATPKRQNGQHPVVFMQCGPVRYRVDAITQAEQSGIARYVLPRFTSFRKPVSLTDQEFGPAVTQNYLSESAARNNTILTDIREVLAQGRTPIVLTQRRDHVTALAAELEKFCPNVIQLLGAAPKKVKQAAMERLKAIPATEPFVMVATGKYVGEGFDEPRLDTLFLVGPVSWTGTLQQYAGRLHREYEGKTKVIIYDYVDFHVPMLENMYHKRIAGYASMGYQAMNAGKPDESNNAIYYSHSFLPVFEKDVYAARQEVIISSPYMKKFRTTQMLKMLSAALINGARVTVITRPVEEYKLAGQPGVPALHKALTDAGIRVLMQPGAHQKFAVIDQGVVWYGNIHLLGYGSAEESIMRLEQREIAEELLRLIN